MSWCRFSCPFHQANTNSSALERKQPCSATPPEQTCSTRQAGPSQMRQHPPGKHGRDNTPRLGEQTDETGSVPGGDAEDEDAGSAAAHNPGGITLVRQTLKKIKTSQAKRPPSHAVHLQLVSVWVCWEGLSLRRKPAARTARASPRADDTGGQAGFSPPHTRPSPRPLLHPVLQDLPVRQNHLEAEDKNLLASKSFSAWATTNPKRGREKVL